MVRWCRQCDCVGGVGVSVPAAGKCCFCVPVRTGVIIFGYVNLVLSLLWFPLLVFLLVQQAAGVTEVTGGAGDAAPLPPPVYLSLALCFVTLDAAMTVVMLVGAHQRRRVLLLVYVWWGGGVQLLMLGVDLLMLDTSHAVYNALYALFFGLNVYLLYLVYSCAARLRPHADYVQYHPPPPHIAAPPLGC